MLIGRERELAAAGDCIAAGRTLALRGDVGAGKTAVLHAAASASGRAVLAGGGLAGLRWHAYLPLMRALRRPMPRGDAAAVADFVVSRVRTGLLVLDDLQWADAETLRLLPLVGTHVAVAVAWRDHDPATPRAEAATHAAGALSLAIEGLEDAAAAQLVRNRNPTLAEVEVARIVAACGGNPLFLEEQARTGRRAVGLAQLIAARLADCSDDAVTAAAMLALAGRPLQAALLGDAAAELLATGLATEDAGAIRLGQPIVGDAATGRLSEAQRRGLHARLGRALRDPGEAARHLAAAGALREAGKLALEAAQAARSPGERARHLGLAAACSEDEQEVASLRLRAAQALVEAGDHAAATAMAAPLTSDARRWVRSDAALTLARARLGAGDAAGAEAAADAGLVDLTPTSGALEVALRVELVRALALGGSQAAEVLHEARDLARRARALGAPLARPLLALGSAELAAGTAGWPRSIAAAAAAAAEEGDLEAELSAAHVLVVGHLLGGSAETAYRLAVEMSQRSRAALLRAWELQFTASRLWLDLHLRGACEAVAGECRRLRGGAVPATLAARLAALEALALADCGRIGEAERATEEAAASDPGSAEHGLVAWTRAEIAWLAGRVEDAARDAAACQAAPAPVPALAAVTAAWAASELEAPPPVQATVPPAPHGGTAVETAAVGRMAADPAAAARGFGEAGRAWADRQLRGQLRCAWALGEALRRAGDTDAARSVLGATQQRMEESGLVALLPRLRRSLRAAGVRQAAPRSADGLGLSEREREVLLLAGEGLSSTAIARRLQISLETVEAHVGNAVVKLGAANRTEAVARLTGTPSGGIRSGAPIVIVEDAADVRRIRAELTSGGWIVRDGWHAPGDDFDLDERKVVLSGRVDGDDERRAALVAGARGAGLVVVEPPADDGFLADLDRLARSRGLLDGVDWRSAGPVASGELTEEMRRLLLRLADGETVADAAAAMHLSLRNAHRRLSAARAALGVETTREAIVAVMRRRG